MNKHHILGYFVLTHILATVRSFLALYNADDKKIKLGRIFFG